MRLLVTGTNGQIGWELSRRLELFGEVIPLRGDECDFAQPARLPTIIRRIGPDVIINAAAYTAVDKAEHRQELAFIVNGASVGIIAAEARTAGAYSSIIPRIMLPEWEHALTPCLAEI
jgi:dTDP-4-dehydrorhamnose reductase